MSQRMISARVQGIGSNVFAEISQLAVKYGAVNLGQGFPSFHTPDFVKQAAIDAINSNHNQYSRPGGVPSYVTVLAEMYSPLFRREINALTEIVTFNGAQEGIAAIMAALLEPGDEVVTLEPYFDAYRTVATLMGIKTIGVPLVLPPSTQNNYSSSDFQINIDQLAKVITPRTKMLVLNTPHNPTGKLLTSQEIQDIVALLEEHPHVTVLSDEVYEFMCYDGLTHQRIAATSSKLFDRTISLFSAGKTFSCTGWRVGYAIGPAHLLKGITSAHSTIPFCGTTPFEVALSNVFQIAKTNGYYDELKENLENKRNRLVKALESANWRPIVPQGGYFVCCDVSHLEFFQECTKSCPEFTSMTPKEEFPDYKFAYKLVQDAKLALIPTSPFFSTIENKLQFRGLVRLAFCKNDEELDDAIAIISKIK